MPLATMGIAGHESYTVTDLWTGAVQTMSQAQLADWSVTVAGYNQSGGGFRIFKIAPSDGMTVQEVDDSDPSVDAGPSVWENTDPAAFDGTISEMDQPGESISYTFQGQSITMLGETNSDEAPVNVYLDGVLQQSLNEASLGANQPQEQYPIYEQYGLTPGWHTIEVVLQGGANGSYVGGPGVFRLDGFAVGLDPNADPPPPPAVTTPAANVVVTTSGQRPTADEARLALAGSAAVKNGTATLSVACSKSSTEPCAGVLILSVRERLSTFIHGKRHVQVVVDRIGRVNF